VLALLE